MSRSYGTITLRMRAVGSDYFVRLDFSPVYNAKHKKEPSARRIFIYIPSNGFKNLLNPNYKNHIVLLHLLVPLSKINLFFVLFLSVALLDTQFPNYETRLIPSSRLLQP